MYNYFVSYTYINDGQRYFGNGFFELDTRIKGERSLWLIENEILRYCSNSYDSVMILNFQEI